MSILKSSSAAWVECVPSPLLQRTRIAHRRHNVEKTMAAGNKVGGKIRDKLEEEASREAVNFYRAWRQKTKNGILPIGIANVGKTTLLQRFQVEEPSLFLEFNRTLKVNVDEIRLREDLLREAKGVEFYKSIDVPGDLPDQWASAYFDNGPRVLVLLVDERDHSEHIKAIRKFLGQVSKGPSFWQKAKEIISFRWGNISRVIFVVNKADRFVEDSLKEVMGKYKEILADIQSTLNVPVQTYRVSLSKNGEDCSALFKAMLDGLSRK